MSAANWSIAFCTMSGHGVVEAVAGFAGLEEDVRVLRGAAQHGAVGGQAACAVGVDQLSSIMARMSSSRELLDLGDFVRGAEAIEEVQEGHARFQRGGLGDQRQVCASWTSWRPAWRSRSGARP